MTITLVDFIARASIDRETLEIWIEEDWVLPQSGSGAPEFSESDLARARLIQNLIDDLGVNTEGVGVALHLIDQVHDLRRALTELAERSRE
jgi:chaperone modulatory protein CbpM